MNLSCTFSTAISGACALLFAISNVNAQQVNRYQIPTYSSVIDASRSFAVIAVRNASGGPTCNVSVTFKTLSGQDVCTLSMNLPVTHTGHFCTRPTANSSFPCTTNSTIFIAVCSNPLTYNLGNAVVRSDNTPGCEKIQVDAIQFHTRDVNDAFVDSRSSLRVVKAGIGSAGD